jgi:hypothetical protein
MFSVDNDETRSRLFLEADADPGSRRGGLAGDFLVC